MSRFLIIVGVIFIISGVVYPLIQKTGLGRLPGDIHFEKGNFKFYFPVTTSFVISVIVTMFLWLLKKVF